MEPYNNRLRFALKAQGESMCPIGKCHRIRSGMCAIGTIPIPIVKKENGKKKNDYRGIMLIPTLYKVYMAILTKKLENVRING